MYLYCKGLYIYKANQILSRVFAIFWRYVEYITKIKIIIAMFFLKCTTTFVWSCDNIQYIYLIILFIMQKQ